MRIKMSAVLEICQKISKEMMSKQDVSHDYHHILRVVKWAELIMSTLSEGSFDRELVLCGCYLHDIADHKYTQDKTPEEILERLPEEYGNKRRLLEIIQRTSWSVQLREKDEKEFIELQIVRDSDRLGKYGTRRAFATAAKRGFPLVLPTTPKFWDGGFRIGQEDGSLAGHFYVKLFHIPEKPYFGFSKEEASKMMENLYAKLPNEVICDIFNVKIFYRKRRMTAGVS